MEWFGVNMFVDDVCLQMSNARDRYFQKVLEEHGYSLGWIMTNRDRVKIIRQSKQSNPTEIQTIFIVDGEEIFSINEMTILTFEDGVYRYSVNFSVVDKKKGD